MRHPITVSSKSARTTHKKINSSKQYDKPYNVQNLFQLDTNKEIIKRIYNKDIFATSDKPVGSYLRRESPRLPTYLHCGRQYNQYNFLKEFNRGTSQFEKFERENKNGSNQRLNKEPFPVRDHKISNKTYIRERLNRTLMSKREKRFSITDQINDKFSYSKDNNIKKIYTITRRFSKDNVIKFNSGIRGNINRIRNTRYSAIKNDNENPHYENIIIADRTKHRFSVNSKKLNGDDAKKGDLIINLSKENESINTEITLPDSLIFNNTPLKEKSKVEEVNSMINYKISENYDTKVSKCNKTPIFSSEFNNKSENKEVNCNVIKNHKIDVLVNLKELEKLDVLDSSRSDINEEPKPMIYTFSHEKDFIEADHIDKINPEICLENTISEYEDEVTPNYRTVKNNQKDPILTQLMNKELNLTKKKKKRMLIADSLNEFATLNKKSQVKEKM